MQSINKDLDQFDQAINQWFQFMKRPSTWSDITTKAGINLNRPGAYILRILLSHPDSQLTITKLAKILGVEAPSVSREISDMEKLGLVKRLHKDKDKRTVYLTVTAKAEKINKQLNTARQSINKSVLEKWSVSDRQTFVKLFYKYVNDVTGEKI